MLADFHLHSRHSDGRLDPAALVDVVADAGVEAFALTDHDTTAGHVAAKAQAAARGVRFVPGIEMTAFAFGRVIHVLGLGCQSDDAELGAANANALDVWDSNQQRWIAALSAEGKDVNWRRDFSDHPVRLPVLIERLCLLGLDGGDPRRVHAHFKAFFAALPHDAYERLPEPREAAATIRRAGGIALLAHPWTLHEERLLEALAPDCDGFEAVYLAYDAGRQAVLTALAARLGKLYSGGSDYHGYFETCYQAPGFEAPSELVARL